ncbi:MAG: hypothetical protein ACK5GI_03795 [Ignavibacteria bacterium]|jgi:hypothetical protein
MMKFYAIMLIAFTLGAANMRAQESDTVKNDPQAHKMEWSVSVNGAYAMHEVDFNSLPPIENCCLGFENTNSIGYGGSIGISFPLTDGGLRVGLNAGYMQLPAQFSSFTTDPVYVPGQGTVNAVFKHLIDLTFHTVPVDVMFEYPVLESVWFGLGVNGNYIASASYKQLETLEEPSSLTFENGSKTRIDTTASLAGYNSLVINGVVSLRARLASKLGSIRGIDLTASYVHPFTDVYDPQTWQGLAGNPPRSYYINAYRISMIKAGLSVAF